MLKTPKSLRLQIGLFGRTNVGKSTFLNYVAGQDVAITSPIPGTTTDVVEKVMELLPIGPVVFLDTAGINDVSALSELRIKKTKKIFDRCDIFVLVTEPNVWTEFEVKIAETAKTKKAPLIVIVNKADTEKIEKSFPDKVKVYTENIIFSASLDKKNRNKTINEFKHGIIKICPDDFLKPPPLLGDLFPKNGVVVLIVPIDLEAPKGRIILPQVQAVRDTLDASGICIVVKESEYTAVLKKLKSPPDIVVCDSQVVDKMVKDTPKGVKCTTFSILLSRYKGDLIEQVKGASVIKSLKPGDKILIAESCSHHPIEDDIGRVKMPRWFKEYVGGEISIDTVAGSDFPEDVKKYKLIVHCGGCMIGRKEMLSRIEKAKEAGVPITNYGIAISVLKGVLERVLSPFFRDV